jgi:protein-S-isoprenylcysteine O-methyltransferase Ste14
MAKKKDTKVAHAADQPRLSQHPKAQQQISSAKAWGGLVLFLLFGFVSMQQGLPAATVVFRALSAGVIGYVVAWAVALVVWRQVAMNEVETVRARLRDEHDAESADVAA